MLSKPMITDVVAGVSLLNDDDCHQRCVFNQTNDVVCLMTASCYLRHSLYLLLNQVRLVSNARRVASVL